MDGDRGSSELRTAGTIDLSRQESVVDLTGKVNQLPCCIKYDGPSPVSDYFKTKQTGIEVDGFSVEEAYFRGRKLQGTTIPLPQGYSGIILGKKNLDESKDSCISEENSNHWEMKGKFQNITLWNHDSLPSQNDDLLRAFHWFAVASALHKPVTLEELESASTDMESL